MSRREYKTINRRMQAGRLASIKEGNYISSRNPYGYKKISPEPKIHTLEIVHDEAEVIKMIFNMYLNGKGAKAIANELNNSGIKPQKSEYWESPTIKKILDNPLYCGKVHWKSEIYNGMHEGIISEEIFNAVQYKRKNNPAIQLHPNDVLHNYYNRILYCKNCGHQLKRRSICNREYMLCAYRQCNGITVSASMQSIDEAVISSFRYRIKKLQNMQSENNSESSEQIKPDMRKPLIAELDKIKKQRTKLYDLLEQEVYDISTFLERSELLNGKQKEIEKQLKAIELEIKEEKMPPEKAITALQYVIDNFNSATATEKNKMLKSVVRKIYYTKTEKMCYNKHSSDLSLEVDFL